MDGKNGIKLMRKEGCGERKAQVKVDSNSGMLALLQRNQDIILNGESALICTSLLVSMQLMEGRVD